LVALVASLDACWNVESLPSAADIAKMSALPDELRD
jgi:hypothetical protein